MKFFKHLLDIKTPSHIILLDIALALSIVPHLFVMKGFMLLYLGIALFFIFRGRKSSKESYLLMGIGLLLVGLSFFNNYNFSDFSRMQFFVSLVSSLLILAVTLQRLTKEINIYLKISPALLMLLSFFFFATLPMLFYAIFTLYVFTLLLIWSRMQSTLGELIRLNSKLFILSLPAVLVMFLAFPRIAFEKAEFGFKSDEYGPIGYSGKMLVSEKEIKLSNRPIMELSFKDELPLSPTLYFRASTLTQQKGLEWSKDNIKHKREQLIPLSKPIEYDITLYPHAQKWIYVLEMPLLAPNKTTLESDYTLSAEKDIYEKKRYSLQAIPRYKLTSNELSSALSVESKKNDKTYEAIKPIKDLQSTDSEKARLLLQFFKDQNLSYTLKPQGINLEDFTDSFLFEAKNGYCIHFASAFAESARMLGIPSRVVTGFKADKSEMINNYLIIKQSDAHAWVELYIEKDGWVRFEPTATALKNLDIGANTVEQKSQSITVFEKLNRNFMYLKYTLESAILDYNRLKQMAILEKLFNDTLYLIKFILAIAGVVLITFLLFFSIKNSTPKEPLMYEMQKLFKLLKKYNLEKKESESMLEFLQRAEQTLGISLSQIDTIYHQLRYAKDQNRADIDELKNAIEAFKMKLSTLNSKSH